MQVNGERFVLPDEAILLNFLRARGYDPRLIAVGLNGEIVRRSDYGTQTLNDDDVVEIVHLMAGG